MSPTLHIHLLGDFHILLGTEPLRGLDSPRLQALLAYLLLHRDAPQSRAHLAFTFWPDSTEAQARTNLRKQVYYLRRALPNADSYLEADTQVVQWRSESDYTLDVVEFELALVKAEQAEKAGEPAERQAALERAVHAYTGDLLPSCYDEWILGDQERLRQAFIGAEERLVEMLEGERAYAAAIKHARHLLQHDPLHETTYRRLMRLEALNGNRARALRTYHACATVLERDLGVEPSPATRRLYERLMKRPAVPVAKRAGRAAALPLIGRGEEWGMVRRAWRVLDGTQPQVVVLAGEAGMGKTRLSEEFTGWAQRQGIQTAVARCYASEVNLAYTPVASWLRSHALEPVFDSLDPVWLSELARLIPELMVQYPNLVPPGPLVEGWQRQRLFEALVQVLHGRRQLLLVLDDTQWCDRETLEWLAYLLQARRPEAPLGGGHARLLVLATMRMEEAAQENRLASLLADLRHGQSLVEVNLQPLDEEETAALASQVAGRELESELAADLYRETGGNPLFIIEMVRAGPLDRGGPREPARPTVRAPHWPLPLVIREAILARLGRLSPSARDVLSVAAVVGREFTFPVLAEIHGQEEEATVHALDELWQRGILREQGADAYGFSHDKVREVAYEELSPVRRRYLHQRVAETLCTLYPANLDALSGHIAGHFDQAGLAEQAVVYYRRAAEAARRIYANEDAAASLQRACYLFDQMPTSQQLSAKGYRLGGQCCEDKGDALVELRDFDGARAAYKQALTRVPSDERLWHSRLHCKMGQVAQSQGDVPLAWQEYALAEQALGEEIFEPVSDWWQAWIGCQLGRMWAHYSLAQADEIAAIAEQCQDSVMEFGTAEQRADFLACQLAAAFRRERYRVSEETLALAHIAYSTSMEAASDQREISLAWFRLGFVRLWGGDLDGALDALRTGLPLAEEIHDLELHTQFLVYLAVVHRHRGDTEAVQALAEQTRDAAGQSSLAIYDAAAKANLGWLAWREGNRREMRALVHEAIRLWQASSYPFAWLARMPLLADALERNQIAESVEQAQALLDPVQMQFPNDLATVLEQAVATWHMGDSDRTQGILASAVALAQVHGYV